MLTPTRTPGPLKLSPATRPGASATASVSSLAEVQILDDDFTVDTGTPEGQADLAERIELLRNEEEA